MPVQKLRNLTGRERSLESNRRLACFLALIAGATDVGGYIALRQFTSHMTGIVSAMADNSVLGNVGKAMADVSAVVAFLAGAACTAVLVNWGRRLRRQSEYALPLMLEAMLLLLFGLAGRMEGHRLFAPAAVLLLCFTMGLQNAIITKISNAVIRTTHITGMVTDIGIELGKLFYWNTSSPLSGEPDVRADRQKLRLLSLLVLLFFGGGILGASGFKHLGFMFTLPLAAILAVLASVPVLDDMNGRI